MPTPKTASLNRRQMLKGTAAASAAVTAGITFGASGTVLAKATSETNVEQTVTGKGAGLLSHALCKAHHKEMAQHLSSVLNASYVEERMADVIVTTTNECLRCQEPVEASMKTRAAFATLK
ncbi:MAG: twin-arginine translocation signal domain-containing protein [Pseudomonadota bacterium]